MALMSCTLEPLKYSIQLEIDHLMNCGATFCQNFTQTRAGLLHHTQILIGNDYTEIICVTSQIRMYIFKVIPIDDPLNCKNCPEAFRRGGSMDQIKYLTVYLVQRFCKDLL